MKQDWLEVEFSFPDMGQGQRVLETPFESALTRPLQVALEDGKPPGPVKPVLICEGASNRFFVIGSICATYGDRFLFFPGVIGSQVVSVRRDSKPTEVDRTASNGEQLDHVTLDKDRSTHVTCVSGQRIPSKGRLLQETDGLYYWFSLTLARLSCLEPHSEKYILRAPTPATDRERITRISSALHEEDFPLLRLPDEPGYLSPNEFLHIDVYFDEVANTQRSEVTPLPPDGPPILTTAIELPSRMPAHYHHIGVPGSQKALHIIVTKHVGIPKADVFLRIPDGSRYLKAIR